MTSKHDLFQSLICEKNGKFNGVRAELQNEEIPAEIREILNQKKQQKKNK